jgi:hypothetical protein
MTFEVEGEDAKAIFRELSSIQEVFDSEKQCGVCHGTEIRFLARQVDDYQFYELACQTQGCRARFSFGQARKGGALFPKRKDEDGRWLDNGGWSKYEPQAQAVQQEQTPQRPQPVATPVQAASQVRPQPVQRPHPQAAPPPAAPQYNRPVNRPQPGTDAEYAATFDDVPF